MSYITIVYVINKYLMKKKIIYVLNDLKSW